MAAVNTKAVLISGAVLAASSVAWFLTNAFRATSYALTYKRENAGKKVYMSAMDENKLTNPLTGIESKYMIPLNLFTSTDQSIGRSSINPALSLSLSVDVFEAAVGSVASIAKWPVSYLEYEWERRECERLAMYLMGIASTYMGNGPTTINVSPSTQLSLTTLYFCAANLGIPDAFTGPIGRPRTKYGLSTYADDRDECIAAQLILGDSSSHAVQNSIITFYELVILFLCQAEEYDSALTLLGRLKRTHRVRAFLAFVYLATDEFELFEGAMNEIISLLPTEAVSLRNFVTEQRDLDHGSTPLPQRLQKFYLPILCSQFTEPFQNAE